LFIIPISFWVFLFLLNNFAFINYQILTNNDSAISWHNITSLKFNDITHD
jgi:hypothetical protein